MGLQNLDFIVFIIYFVIVSAYGIWIYNRKKKATMDSHDFFLAEGTLTWWAIGSSLIASNISAEQFVGMSGDGFFAGVAVAAYEWVAAIALIIIAVWFIPIYLKNKIYTMPQFLKMRYNTTVSLIMTVFWLFLYVLVNLTSILYLGAKAIDGLTGGEYLHAIMLGLAIFALIITLGGMKVVAYTDVIQVAVLIIGGIATIYFALNQVSQHVGNNSGAWNGFTTMMEKADDHFHMIFKKPASQATTPIEQYHLQRYVILPGIVMYLAGQWIVNLNYWGCNQYITQRALGANLNTARTGILFAGMLKLFMPVIVMLPGIAAYVLYKHSNVQLSGLPAGVDDAHLYKIKDNAYSSVLAFLPTGLRGLSVAALTAAIVASLAGKANSISTIFTLDIYKKYLGKNADEKQLVTTGRITIVAAMLFGVFLTWNDALGIGGEGGFTFIQKYTGFISPGILAMFLLGMFWKRTTGAAAIAGILIGFLTSVIFNNYAPAWFGHETLLYTAFEVIKDNKQGVPESTWEIPFLVCMGWSFVFTVVSMVAISMAGPKVNPKAIDIEPGMFRVSPKVAVMIVITLLLLTAIYVKFW